MKLQLKVDVTPVWWTKHNTKPAIAAAIEFCLNEALVHEVFATRQKLLVSIAPAPSETRLGEIEQRMEVLREKLNTLSLL